MDRKRRKEVLQDFTIMRCEDWGRIKTIRAEAAAERCRLGLEVAGHDPSLVACSKWLRQSTGKVRGGSQPSSLDGMTDKHPSAEKPQLSGFWEFGTICRGINC